MDWRRARLVGLMATMVLAACSGCGDKATGEDDDDGKQDAGDDFRPGFGSSDKAPEGTPFALPAGVELVEPIPGIDMFNWEDCRDDDETEPPQEHGSGDLVQLCLNFRNNTGSPVTVEFPPGIIFESETTKTQHGILVQRASIEVPAKPASYKLLYLYCLNNSRGASGLDSRYRKGPVTQYADFKELFTLLENKKIPTKLTPEIQAAVYNLAGDRGLSSSDRAYINSLPNK
ncbi:hypothetical protein [Corallococcus sp. RDP092CA]|uniref:hypothetical protein n=1 Tax=Corallococcus sp. RDP092CA TaxID=3109369 RepID=UPI0035AF2274